MTIPATSADPKAFVYLTSLEHRNHELEEEVDFLRGFIRATLKSEEDPEQVEKFLRDVEELVAIRREERVVIVSSEGVCGHKNRTRFGSSLGMLQCTDCGENIDPPSISQRAPEIEKLLGKSLPEEPLPLIPGLMPPKHQFLD